MYQFHSILLCSAEAAWVFGDKCQIGWIQAKPVQFSDEVFIKLYNTNDLIVIYIPVAFRSLGLTHISMNTEALPRMIIVSRKHRYTTPAFSKTLILFPNHRDYVQNLERFLILKSSQKVFNYKLFDNYLYTTILLVRMRNIVRVWREFWHLDDCQDLIKWFDATHHCH